MKRTSGIAMSILFVLASVALMALMALMAPGAGASAVHGSDDMVAAGGSSAADLDTNGSGHGYWVLSVEGVVVARGNAAHHGQPAPSSARWTSLMSSASGKGYWAVDSSGRVEAFGDARFLGDLRSTPLAAPIIDAQATPSGRGYWLLGADGGIFTFGDAAFHGSTGNIALNAPVIAFATTPSGGGYWLLGADGGIFTFGDARFHGSTGNIALNAPVVGFSTSESGRGYTLVASDGGVFTFGDARFHGSLAPLGVGDAERVADNAPADGYLVLRASGVVHALPGWRDPVGGQGEATNVATELFRAINAERSARGLSTLAYSSEIQSAASAWARQLPAIGSLRHSDLGASPLMASGRWSYLGENLYAGGGSTASADAAHAALMGSASHRASLLNPTFTHAAVSAFCDASGRLWVVQQFGRVASAGPGSAAPQVAASAPVDLDDNARC